MSSFWGHFLHENSTTDCKHLDIFLLGTVCDLQSVMEHAAKQSNNGFKALVCVQSSTELCLIRQTLEDIIRCTSITESNSIDSVHLAGEFQLLVIDGECVLQAESRFAGREFTDWMKGQVEMVVFLLEDIARLYGSSISEIGRHASVIKPYTLTEFQNALAAAFSAAGKSEGEIC